MIIWDIPALRSIYPAWSYADHEEDRREHRYHYGTVDNGYFDTSKGSLMKGSLNGSKRKLVIDTADAEYSVLDIEGDVGAVTGAVEGEACMLGLNSDRSALAIESFNSGVKILSAPKAIRSSLVSITLPSPRAT